MHMMLLFGLTELFLESSLAEIDRYSERRRETLKALKTLSSRHDSTVNESKRKIQ